ncbi:uncharacterized protein LOC108736471 isoform X2 [Agrilus planipennis]|uniref:Uncharacterized protein LOC108736471 isoform X2 n=1 Tax=Agrilus planipennis TaxID=224129 RepID=A0A1W4WWA4_AGRPL|nr:uncharacterized protein LOC108736471 isoform X2 [Agrilus planipennis]
MSWETRSTNASQNSVGSDSTFCEELEKNNRSLRKRTSLKYSQSSFNSQTQIKTLPIKSKTNENKKYKKILEDCVFKIRNHLRKIRIMSINEIQSLVNDINKINTSNRESQAMKGKVLRQLRSLFEETTEIEQRFSSLNISNSQAINIFQNSCSKSYQDVTVNDSENTITSNKSNGEELESSFSFDFVNGSEVNINQFPNCTHSSSIVNTIQKDLKKLEEIDMLKNQDPTNKYYEEILQKSSTISLSFDEDMLSNVNFKTPTAKTSLCTQFDSTNIIDDIQSEKSNISNNSPICQAKEEIFNFLPKNMDSEDIIPSSLIENNTKMKAMLM